MSNRRSDDKENSAASLFVLLSIILLLLVVVIGVFSGLTEEKKQYNLTIDQQQKIAHQIGIKGYKVLIKNSCSSVIAEKIETGKWVDYWCAEHYNKLDFN